MTIQSHNFTYPYDGLDRVVEFFNSSNATKQVHGVLIALHGFAQPPGNLLPNLYPLLELGYAAAIPHGIERSWNGGACCGEAKKRQIDDVGFITSLAKYFIAGHWMMRPNCKVFVVGFSNGGFLTSRIALTTLANNNGTWLDGFLIVAAYEYDVRLYDKAIATRVSHRFPVMLVHGLADTTVNPSGCCDASPIPCCCEITNGKTCFTLRQSFELWSKINECDSTKTGQMNITHNEFPFGYDSDCYKPSNCMGSVTLCEIPQAGHSFGVGKVIAQVIPEWYSSAIALENNINRQQQDHPLLTTTNSTTNGTSTEISPFGLAAILLVIVFVLLWGINFVWGNRNNDSIPVEGGSISTAGSVVNNQDKFKKSGASRRKYELVSTQAIDRESNQIDESG